MAAALVSVWLTVRAKTVVLIGARQSHPVSSVSGFFGFFGFFCGAVRLAAISLAKCHLVTDTGLGMLSAACPQLRSINLEATSNLTEAAMLALAAGCRELRSINLKNKCDLKVWYRADLGFTLANLFILAVFGRGVGALSSPDYAPKLRALISTTRRLGFDCPYLLAPLTFPSFWGMGFGGHLRHPGHKISLGRTAWER